MIIQDARLNAESIKFMSEVRIGFVCPKSKRNGQEKLEESTYHLKDVTTKSTTP